MNSLMTREFLPRALPRGWHELGPIQPPGHGVVGFGYRHGSGLAVLASVDEAPGERWLHISCSRERCLPSWDDLKAVKRVFIGPERTAWQIIAPDSEWVNEHEYCLHLWSWIGDGAEPPRPPLLATGEIRK